MFSDYKQQVNNTPYTKYATHVHIAPININTDNSIIIPNTLSLKYCFVITRPFNYFLLLFVVFLFFPKFAVYL